MNPGSPLKLASQKLREGNQGKHKSIAELEKEAEAEPKPQILESIPDIPKFPRELRKLAQKEWHRVCNELISTHRLSEGMLGLLEELCLVYAATQKLWSKGECPNASLLAQKRYLYETFGLTPASIGKTRSQNGKEKASKLARFQRIK